MEKLYLEAERRSGHNTKGQLNSLRKEGWIPGVLYGRGKDSIPLVLDVRLVRQVLSSEAGENAVVELQIKNGNSNKNITENVMFKEIQRDILVRERLLHVDLIRISLTEKILVNVPVQFVGESEAPGVKEGGLVQALLREVEVYCLPASIPESLDVDISHLDVGDSVVANELVLPKGVELRTEPEETLAQVLMPRQEEEVEEEVEDLTEEVLGEPASEEEESSSESEESTEE